MLIQKHIHEHMEVNITSEGSFSHRDPRVSSNWPAELALYQERRVNKNVNFKSYTKNFKNFKNLVTSVC